MHASRFRNCAFAERSSIGGARKKGGSQRPRAALRREIHAAQEALEARVGADDRLVEKNVIGWTQMGLYFDPSERQKISSGL
jgi:hypothetical protein